METTAPIPMDPMMMMGEMKELSEMKLLEMERFDIIVDAWASDSSDGGRKTSSPRMLWNAYRMGALAMEIFKNDPVIMMITATRVEQKEAMAKILKGLKEGPYIREDFVCLTARDVDQKMVEMTAMYQDYLEEKETGPYAYGPEMVSP